MPESERRSAAALRPWRGQESTRGRWMLSGRCMGERGIQKSRGSARGRLYIGGAVVHRGRSLRRTQVRSWRGEERVLGGGRQLAVSQTPRRPRETRWGGPRWPEAAGRGGYSAGAYCSALQSAQMSGIAILKGQGHVHLCPGASLDALEWSGARWGAAYSNERERGGVAMGKQREKEMGFTPKIIELLKEESY